MRGNNKDNPRLSEAAEVDDGDQSQNAQANRQRVRLELGHGGYECADAGRNTHGHGQDVIDHERGGGQQSGGGAQVSASHGVRSASARIRSNRLQVGKEEYDQQNENRGGDWNDVVNSERSERDEQRERGFRAIRGGTQRIQAEDGDSGGGPDSFGALIHGPQRLAKQKIGEGHQFYIARAASLTHAELECLCCKSWIGGFCEILE